VFLDEQCHSRTIPTQTFDLENLTTYISLNRHLKLEAASTLQSTTIWHRRAVPGPPRMRYAYMDHEAIHSLLGKARGQRLQRQRCLASWDRVVPVFPPLFLNHGLYVPPIHSCTDSNRHLMSTCLPIDTAASYILQNRETSSLREALRPGRKPKGAILRY
jgi:hypothetical protein